jgi:hypothetical protein
MTRFIAASALAWAVFLNAGIAHTHGGDQVYSGRAGAYQVRAYANWADGWLDYSIEVRNAATGALVPDARVIVSVFDNGTKSADYTAYESGAVYEFVEKSRSTVQWRLVIDIQSALGAAKLTHRLDLKPTNWLWPTAAVAASFFAAVAAHLFVARRRTSA